MNLDTLWQMLLDDIDSNVTSDTSYSTARDVIRAMNAYGAPPRVLHRPRIESDGTVRLPSDVRNAELVTLELEFVRKVCVCVMQAHIL